MADRWEWLHRLNTTQSLLVAVFGGPAVAAAIQALLSLGRRPTLPWWGYLIIVALFSGVIGLVVLRGHVKAAMPSIEELSQSLKTEHAAHLHTADILRREAEIQTQLFKDTHAKYLEAVEENKELRICLRDATRANTKETRAVGVPTITQGPAPSVEILSPLDHCEVGLNCTVSGRVSPANHPVQVLVYGRDTEVFYLQGDAEVRDHTWSRKCQFGNPDKLGGTYEVIAVCGKNIKESRLQWLPDWLVKSKPILDVRRTS